MYRQTLGIVNEIFADLLQPIQNRRIVLPHSHARFDRTSRQWRSALQDTVGVDSLPISVSVTLQ